MGGIHHFWDDSSKASKKLWALSNAKRIKILAYLYENVTGTRTELAGCIGKTVQETSSEIIVLEKAGLVKKERLGSTVICSNTDNELVKLLIDYGQTI